MTLDRYFGLSGKVALLTGATGGIGRALADAFAAAGATLVVTSNDAVALDLLVEQLSNANCRTTGILCDVRDARSVEALAHEAEAVHSRIDILLANAGIVSHSGPMASATDAQWDDGFAVNLRHAARLASLIAPGMAARRDGAIIFTSSIAGMRGNKTIGLYGMTKAALAQLARNVAVEWGPFNVRANALAPGLIATAWADAILRDPVASERRLSLTPLRRVGEPWEVAAAALFLASPGGGFVTGHTLTVDGGTVISDGN